MTKITLRLAFQPAGRTVEAVGLAARVFGVVWPQISRAFNMTYGQ